MALGLLHALFLILAFPPFSLWGFAFLIPMPLFVLARDPRLPPSRAALWGAVGAAPAWLWTHIWIKDVSAMGLPLLVIILSCFTFLFLWIASHLVPRCGRAVLLLPLIWIGVEFFRGNIFGTGYPWYMTAHPLVMSPRSVLAMPASWGGYYLVGWLCASYSVLLLLTATATTHHLRKRAGLAAAGVFASWIFAGLSISPPEPAEDEFLRFSVVQPDVPQDNRESWTVRQRVRDWLTLREITIESARDPKNPHPLDLIIWPEGFVPGWTLDPVSLETERGQELAWNLTPRDADDVPELRGLPPSIPATQVVDDMLAMQEMLGIPMLVGAAAFENLRIVETDRGFQYERDAMYNSAFLLIDGEPQQGWYNKLHLTPFGEVMPGISNWDWLEAQLLALGARGMEFSLSPGEEPKVLSVPVDRDQREIRVATPICFEATVGRVCRRLVFDAGRRRAGVMVNMTNDGWFGGWDAGRESHLLLARWRCIELNTPMIRCANTGVSSVIDRRGRVTNRSITPVGPNPREGYLVDQLPLARGATVYAFMGDAFGWICMLGTLAWGAAAIFGRRQGVRPVRGMPIE